MRVAKSFGILYHGLKTMYSNRLDTVPCLRRAKQMEYTEEDKETEIKDEGADENDDEDGWMYTHSDRGRYHM